MMKENEKFLLPDQILKLFLNIILTYWHNKKILIKKKTMKIYFIN